MNLTLTQPTRCECEYCNEARWLKVVKPRGVRRMMVILHRHHMQLKKAAMQLATV